MSAPEERAPFQPSGQYVIAALQEELRAAQDNRLYLVAALKQMAEDFAQARELWELEKASLIADVPAED